LDTEGEDPLPTAAAKYKSLADSYKKQLQLKIRGTRHQSPMEVPEDLQVTKGPAELIVKSAEGQMYKIGALQLSSLNLALAAYSF
jgi:hypothetical protein